MHWYVIWPVLFLFLIARPIGTTLSLIGSSLDSHQRFLSAWLGLRGVSAFYYLLFCLEQAGKPVALETGPIVLAALVLSAVLHGTGATVLLERYSHRRD